MSAANESDRLLYAAALDAVEGSARALAASLLALARAAERMPADFQPERSAFERLRATFRAMAALPGFAELVSSTREDT